METVSQLRDLVLTYEEKKAACDELEAELKEAKAAKEAAEKAVIDAILTTAETTGIDDLGVTVEGRRYTVKLKDYYSIPKEAREEAFGLLRELGHGDIIVERVDDRTLSSEMAAVIEEYHNLLPEAEEDFPAEYEPLVACMRRYSKPSLSRLKVK